MSSIHSHSYYQHLKTNIIAHTEHMEITYNTLQIPDPRAALHIPLFDNTYTFVELLGPEININNYKLPHVEKKVVIL